MIRKAFTILALITITGGLVFGAASQALAKGGGGGSGGGGLSAEEIAGLLYMREEEKLAHDVYVAMYGLWGLPIFANISQSEQNHTDAVKNLLVKYGLQDPASPKAGVFNNPTLQAMYNDLIAWGRLSAGDALRVGGTIEEVDILDLEKYLALTNHTDIQNVYNNLLCGSHNHLRAFTSTLQAQTGEIYQPLYLSLEAYQAILAEPSGGCGSGSGGGGKGYHGGNP